jgi:pimeloyl-ACP methyl ester carboxylesterase
VLAVIEGGRYRSPCGAAAGQPSLDRPVKVGKDRWMPRASANGIEIEYETFGDRDDVPLLLVSGLGAQMISWDEELCEGLVDRGFYVIRFDNRDVGLSTKVDVGEIDLMAAITTALAGGPVEAPYHLDDMARDAWGLLEAIGIDRAHIVGASMGGMIVQTMAIQHPERVLSLTSIMSTTGNPEYGQPKPEVLPLLLEAAPADRDGYIEHSTKGSLLIGSPDYFDEERIRARHGLAYDRCYYPRGIGHQLVAILSAGSRDEALRGLDLPALVIHGDIDPLVTVTGGERTAECLQGAELVILEDMGHDLPVHFWSRLIDAIVGVASRAEAPTEV